MADTLDHVQSVGKCQLDRTTEGRAPGAFFKRATSRVIPADTIPGILGQAPEKGRSTMTRILAALLSMVLFAGISPDKAPAASIDLGGIKLRLPSVKVKPVYKPKRKTTTSSSTAQDLAASDPVWHVENQEGLLYATNNQGIWIGYTETGDMVMQLEAYEPLPGQQGDLIPVTAEINGKFYTTMSGRVANANMLVVDNLEPVLERFMTGRNVSLLFGGNLIYTHLKGSSAAIRQVRSGAEVQSRLNARGLVKPAANDQAVQDTNIIRYFLPGVEDTGEAEVRFDIVEGTGLVLYMRFLQIPGQGDPTHAIPLTTSETRRAIALLRKGEEWTDVARQNRVGLFSKRIGFADDENGAATEEAANTEGQDENNPPPDEGNSVAGESLGAGETVSQSARDQANDPSSQGQAPAPDKEALDFVAVNFNSYEDGSTSIQVEHSVKGYSRRFNLQVDQALKLADSLEATLEQASFRLEKREFDKEGVDSLFK